jgi:hypothetical protein
MAVQDQTAPGGAQPGSPQRLLIDGECVKAASGRTFERIDSATEQVLAEVAFTGSIEVGRKIVRAAAGHLEKVTLELGHKSRTPRPTWPGRPRRPWRQGSSRP